MGKKPTTTIDALFGSKTRVKLMHLFFNNPNKSFYVREITRLIDEQINSVRRELSNMLNVGVITNDTVDNKLYYQIDHSYPYFYAFEQIFADDALKTKKSPAAVDSQATTNDWMKLVQDLNGVRVAVAAGILVEGSASNVDLLIVGNTSATKLKQAIDLIEKTEGREINYTTLTYDEFYYRYSVRDRFIMEILTGKHVVVVDKDNVLTEE